MASLWFFIITALGTFVTILMIYHIGVYLDGSTSESKLAEFYLIRKRQLK